MLRLVSPVRCFRALHTSKHALRWLSSTSTLRYAANGDVKLLKDPASDVAVAFHASSVSLTAPSLGLNKPFHFDHVWLRDACTEEASVQSSTKQKVFHTSDVHVPQPGHGLLDVATQPHIEPSSLPCEASTLHLAFSPAHPVINDFSRTFSSVPAASKEPHASRFSIATLLTHALPDQYAASHGDIGGAATHWAASDTSAFARSTKSPPDMAHSPRGQPLNLADAQARPARLAWGCLRPGTADEAAHEAQRAQTLLVEALMRDGLAFVTDLPTDKRGNVPDQGNPDSPALARLAEILGEIRHTFYGPLWDVRSLGSSSRNIAYTNVDLGLHMDLCYFQNPPRFQFLHMLSNKVNGGESIFVDSYKVAERMWLEHREEWEILTRTPVGFRYQNDGKHYRYAHPTFELAARSSGHAGEPTASGMPRLTAVNYSPPFQSPLPLSHSPQMSTEQGRRQFYTALRLFADLTLRDEFRYERRLAEGDCVIFDNRRVLHARRGFEWKQEEEGSGTDKVKRWLKGCYVDGDAIWSTYRVLRAQANGGQLGTPFLAMQSQ